MENVDKKKRIKVPTSTTAEHVAFAVDEITKMRAYPATLRRLRENFGLSFMESRGVYESALVDIKQRGGQTARLTKDIYVEALLDLKDRCVDADDLDNEVRLMRDLGRVLNYIESENNTAIVADPERERKAEERLAELLEKRGLKPKEN